MSNYQYIRETTIVKGDDRGSEESHLHAGAFDTTSTEWIFLIVKHNMDADT
jgi:hypothetical protein